MVEIYKETLIDLLSEEVTLELRLKDINHICTVHNLSIREVKTKDEALFLIKKGSFSKKMRETELN